MEIKAVKFRKDGFYGQPFVSVRSQDLADADIGLFQKSFS